MRTLSISFWLTLEGSRGRLDNNIGSDSSRVAARCYPEMIFSYVVQGAFIPMGVRRLANWLPLLGDTF